MFAVIKTGGKQYRVVADDQFEIERIAGEAGEAVAFKEVLMVGTTIGAPFVAGATVTAEIVGHTRGPKVISFKKRRRQNSKRTRGHRQDLTMIRIGEILTDGAEPNRDRTDVFAADLDVGAAIAESEANAEALGPAPADEILAADTTAKKPRAARKPKVSEPAEPDADADAGV